MTVEFPPALMEDLYRREMKQLYEEHGRTPDPDVWRWSPYDIRRFYDMLLIAYKYYRATDTHRPGPISFGEAGSGIGTKLRMAQELGMTEYGFELFDSYIDKAKELGVHCEKRDLGDFDNQPVWSAYDIVYIARPFKDEIKEHLWEELVQEQMRPGAVLISTFSAKKPYEWECLFRAPFRGVWVKPGTARLADPSLVSTVTIG